MNPVLVGVALVVMAGTVVAVSAREPRAALVGLAVALGGAPFLTDPLPALSTLAARVVGAALAAYLLRAAQAGLDAAPGRGRSAPVDRARGGSHLGWPAEALLALAAGLIGADLAANLQLLLPSGGGVEPGDAMSLLTPVAAVTGAGAAAVVAGMIPAFAARDPLRSTIGALLLVQGILLVRTGVAGVPGDLEQLAGVALLVAVAAAGAVIVGLGTGGDLSARRAGRLPAASEPVPGDRDVPVPR